MKNAAKRAPYTMQEWETMCRLGTAIEPEGGRFPRSIPIECPNVSFFNSTTKKARVCKAKLNDTAQTLPIGHKLRRKVRCDVCGWIGSRALGKTHEDE